VCHFQYKRLKNKPTERQKHPKNRLRVNIACTVEIKKVDFKLKLKYIIKCCICITKWMRTTTLYDVIYIYFFQLSSYQVSAVLTVNFTPEASYQLSAYLQTVSVFGWMNWRMGLIGLVTIAWRRTIIQQVSCKGYEAHTWTQKITQSRHQCLIWHRLWRLCAKISFAFTATKLNNKVPTVVSS